MHHKRWYDLDPNLSMAVSLLQNATPQDQETALLHVLETLNMVPPLPALASKHGFPFWPSRRKPLIPLAERFMLTWQEMNPPERLEVAFQLIHALYRLECGQAIGELEPEAVDTVVSSLA